MLQSWLNMMFEIELRCRADRPQLRILLLRWAGVTALPEGAAGEIQARFSTSM